jgi:hypothetical protein
VTKDGTTDAVVDGLRGLLLAAAGWSTNTWRTRLNAYVWGPWWWASLLILVLVGAAISVYLPSLSQVASEFQPLRALAYVPSLVARVVWSAPALIALIIGLRARWFRKTAPQHFAELRYDPTARQQAFDATVLPIAVVSVLLGVVSVIATAVLVEPPTWSMALRRTAEAVAILALVAGLIGSRRTMGSAFGALISAAFSWWIAHVIVGFVAPFMVGFLRFVPLAWFQASADTAPQLAHAALDLGVGLLAWTRLRSLAAEDRFWGMDGPQPPPPPPPPPPPVDTTE